MAPVKPSRPTTRRTTVAVQRRQTHGRVNSVWKFPSYPQRPTIIGPYAVWLKDFATNSQRRAEVDYDWTELEDFDSTVVAKVFVNDFMRNKHMRLDDNDVDPEVKSFQQVVLSADKSRGLDKHQQATLIRLISKVHYLGACNQEEDRVNDSEDQACSFCIDTHDKCAFEKATDYHCLASQRVLRICGHMSLTYATVKFFVENPKLEWPSCCEPTHKRNINDMSAPSNHLAHHIESSDGNVRVTNTYAIAKLGKTEPAPSLDAVKSQLAKLDIQVCKHVNIHGVHVRRNYDQDRMRFLTGDDEDWHWCDVQDHCGMRYHFKRSWANGDRLGGHHLLTLVVERTISNCSFEDGVLALPQQAGWLEMSITQEEFQEEKERMIGQEEENAMIFRY